LAIQIDTTYRTLPAATGAGSRFSSYRQAPKPEFLSQLIAEREHLATQRVKRQATPLEVLRIYDAGGRLKVLRVPPGYRTNIEA
jgi:hypothetical protein